MRYLMIILLGLCSALPANAKAEVEADKSAARIMVYFTVGRDSAPATNVTAAQFEAHLKALKTGNYNVMALSKIINAYEKGKSLPAKTVAITFDGGDKSIIRTAAPLLSRHKIPYTVFIAPARADADDPRYLNWADIKSLEKSPLVSFGLHPEEYKDFSYSSEETIRLRLNNATARLRNQLSDKIDIFSFPFGEYTKKYQDIVSSYGFKAAVGQSSAVAYNETNRFALPRFTMVEDYANIERFDMTASSLPLPVNDVSPITSHINTSNPSIGFTVGEDIESLNGLSCFTSGHGRTALNIIGDRRVEIRLKRPIDESRFRVNCTLPVIDSTDSENNSWRWFGLLLSVNDTVLEKAMNQPKDKSTQD